MILAKQFPDESETFPANCGADEGELKTFREDFENLWWSCLKILDDAF